MVDQKALEYLQDDNADAFNALVAQNNGQVNLSGGQFRGYDLRKYHLQHADLSNCYLRNADLRGVDLSQANLTYASIRDANISGTFFPKSISAEEIRLSVEFGTRLRPAD